METVSKQPNEQSTEEEKKSERNTFIFLTVFLAPVIAIMLVGSYGFIIWFSQLIFGPPGS